MAWFDGSFEFSAAELNELFPVEVTKELQLNEEGTMLAVINDFAPGTELFDLADPKAEEDDLGRQVFIHAFFGKDSLLVRETIERFISAAGEGNGESIVLFRKEADRLFMYSYGHICIKLLNNQEALQALLSEPQNRETNAFLLPLKRYMFRCPVCGHRTLQYRGCFMICPECGWEDEGVDDEDAESIGANGDYTIRQYREEYMQLKSEDPEYSWEKKTNPSIGNREKKHQ